VAKGEQTRGEQTRRAILDAAIVRFGRDGYRATSVADIARESGVSGTAAYAYFPNKEALFLAALDDDAAAVIEEGVSHVIDDTGADDWGQQLFFTLLDAVEHHPLARRILAGLEPGVTDRVIDIPALAELRKACAEKLRSEQVVGRVRADIDPVPVASGIVAIISSLLMSVIQLGGKSAAVHARDVEAVLKAALDPPA
jgi:AcrR family transcriptional regulator